MTPVSERRSTVSAMARCALTISLRGGRIAGCEFGFHHAAHTRRERRQDRVAHFLAGAAQRHDEAIGRHLVHENGAGARAERGDVVEGDSIPLRSSATAGSVSATLCRISSICVLSIWLTMAATACWRRPRSWSPPRP